MPTLRSVPLGVVRQDELEAVIGIRNQLRHLTRIYKVTCSEILARLESGSGVEYGVHQAELVSEDRGPVRITKLLIRVLLICLVNAGVCAAQWGSTKWGMPADQVTVPDQVEIARLPFTVKPEFAAGQLAAINLTYADRTPPTEIDLIRVEQILARKYGRPWRRSADDGRLRMVIAQWTTPDTVIVLQLVRGVVVKLSVRYEKRNPSDEANLD